MKLLSRKSDQVGGTDRIIILTCKPVNLIANRNLMLSDVIRPNHKSCDMFMRRFVDSLNWHSVIITLRGRGLLRTRISV